MLEAWNMMCCRRRRRIEGVIDLFEVQGTCFRRRGDVRGEGRVRGTVNGKRGGHIGGVMEMSEARGTC